MGLKTFSIAATLLFSSTPVYAAHYLEVKVTTSALAFLPGQDGSGAPVDQYYTFKTTADLVMNLDQYPAGTDFGARSPQWSIIDAWHASSQINLYLQSADDPSLYFNGMIPLSGLDLTQVFTRTFHGIGSYTATYLIDGRYDLTGSVSGPINDVLVRTFDTDAVIPTSLTADQSFTPLSAPEPGSWMMMIGGFGIVGGAMRRRRALVHFA